MLKKRFVIFAVVIFIVAFVFSWIQYRFTRFYEKVPVEVYSSSIIIPVFINNQAYNFHLDTGAPTGISPSLFKEIEASVIDSTNAQDLYGNKAWVKNTVIPELQIGKTRFKDVSAGIVNPIQSFKNYGVEVDGYFGGDFFSEKVLMINIKQREVTITNNIEKLLLDKTKALSIDFTRNQKTPLLPIAINGNTSYEDVIFDTGASNDFYLLKQSDFYNMYKSGTLLQRNIIDTLNYESTGYSLFGKQMDAINFVVKFDSIKVGPITAYGVVSRTFITEQKSTLGAKILHQGVVTIDYINGDFYLEPYND